MWKIVFIVLFIVVIGGMTTFLLLPDKKILTQIQPEVSTTPVPSQPLPSPQAPDADPQAGDSQYIKDALTNATTLECDYTDPEGRKVKTYLKNGDVRSNYTADNPEDSAVTIIKDNKMFVWNLSTKEGYMLVLTGPSGSNVNDSQTTYNVVADLEKYKQFCKAAEVSDDQFIPPADVKLEDYSLEGPDAASSQ